MRLGIEIVKRAGELSVTRIDDTSLASDCDLVYTTRLNYLKNSLTNKFGAELLLVGSGGIFEYLRASDVRYRLHEQLIAAIWPPRRHSIVADMKKYARRLLRYQSRPNPMYDLEKWTAFKTESCSKAVGRFDA